MCAALSVISIVQRGFGSNMPTELPLEISTVQRGKWTVAFVIGDLDMATSPELAARCETCEGPLALDLSGVRFIDSTGLRGLFELSQSNDDLVIVETSAVINRLLSLTEMTQVFDIVDGVSSLDT